MKYYLQTRKQVGRTINLIIQSTVLLGLFMLLNNEIAASIPLIVLLWQAIHYGFMAWCDYYADDCPEKKCKYLVYTSMGLWTVAAIFMGVFASPYMRLHIFIVLIGNLIGGKVDNGLWKLFFAIYISIIAYFEFLSPELFILDSSLILYTAMAISVIALCERLSEIHQNAWLIHTTVFGLWAVLQAPFYQEGILFILGSVMYAGLKLLVKISSSQAIQLPASIQINETPAAITIPSVSLPEPKSIASSIATQMPKTSVIISAPQMVNPYTCPKVRQGHINTLKITQKLQSQLVGNKIQIQKPIALKKKVTVLN